MTETVICLTIFAQEHITGTTIMKFQVGYQNDRRFLEYLLAHKDAVGELYFPWESFTTGRGVTLSRNDQRTLENDLHTFSEAGVKLCLLLNGNCYGREALSRQFFQKLGDTVDFIAGEYNLASVTTASPLIGKFIHRNFPDLEVRASVNMEIGTPEGVEYLAEHFDSFYLKREYNYSRDVIIRMRDFCRGCGKKLYILANSGCLNFCSARTFHDNLVAHQHEIAAMDNGFKFHGICSTYMDDPVKRTALLAKSNFIRPEDTVLYEDLCDGMKLATRTNFKPFAVAKAYFDGSWNGNLLELTEPAHAEKFLPAVVANKKFPADYAEHRFQCGKICEKCDYCAGVLAAATVTLNENNTIFYKQIQEEKSC